MNELLWLLVSFGTLTVGILVGRRLTLKADSKIVDAIPARSQLVQSTFELMELVSSTAILLNPANSPVKSTPQAVTMGLVRARELTIPEIATLADSVRASNEPADLELEIVTGIGREPIYLEARAALLDTGYVLVVLSDRTEAKRLADTRRDFIANISHELKTPISAISLLAEAIAEAADDEKAVRRFVESIAKESKRLSRFVNDVIQLSRIQSSDAVTNPERVDLSAVAAEALERNSFLAEKRNVAVELEADEGIEVWGDFEMLAVALKNLIENAILYSESGSTVGVGLSVEGDVASLSVRDNGRGIPLEDQKRIFERFYRVDPSRSRGTGGTGLGLSIVKNIMASHNGEVTLFSKPGVGSTFTLRLPIADRQEASGELERNDE